MPSNSLSVAAAAPGYSGAAPPLVAGGSSTALPGAVPAAVSGGSGAPVSRDAVQKAVADANSAAAQSGTELNFVFDKQANDMIVTVIDRQTHQVVQQIPAKWMTAAARALADAQPGVLINTNA